MILFCDIVTKLPGFMVCDIVTKLLGFMVCDIVTQLLSYYLSTHLKLNLCSLVFLNKYLKSQTLLSPFLQITL